MSWTEHRVDAIAIYPFMSIQEGQINLITGDKLSIIEVSKDWARVKCYSTGCVGICPRNRLLETPNPIPIKRDPLRFEASSLINLLFTKHFLPTNHPTDIDHKIFDNLSMLIGEVSDPSFDTEINLKRSLKISEFIRSIREIIGEEKLERVDSEIKTAHNIENIIYYSNQRSNNSEFQDLSKDSKSLFPITSTIKCTIQFTYVDDVKLSPRLFDLDKKKYVSENADIFLPAHSEQPTEISFFNVDCTNLSKVYLEIRVYQSAGPLEGSSLPQTKRFYEYIGVTAIPIFNDEIYPPSDLTQYPLYLNAQSSDMNSNVLNHFIKNEQKLLSDTGIPISIGISVDSSNRVATFSNEPNIIQPIIPPINLGIDFPMDVMYVTINRLSHHSQFKSTRILLSVFDTETKQFIDSFKSTFDGKEFSSVTQKGELEMDFIETAKISLKEIQSDFSKVFLVFKVVRPSKDRSSEHLSSIGFIPLATNGNCLATSVSTNEVLLSKPPSESLTEEDYVHVISKGTSGAGSSGKITVEIQVSSSEPRSCPDRYVYSLLHWRKQGSIDSTTLSLVLSNYNVLRCYLKDILLSLAELVHVYSDDIKNQLPPEEKEQKQTVLNSGLNTIVSLMEYIDTTGASLKESFKLFLETQFTNDHEYLASIFSPLLEHIVNVFSSNLSDLEKSGTNDEVAQQFKAAARCLPYIVLLIRSALQLSKDLNIKVDEVDFRTKIESIILSLGNVVSYKSESSTFIKIKAFIYSNFGALPDVIGQAWDEKTTCSLIGSFLENASKDVSERNKGLQIKLINSLLETKFLNQEANRNLLVNPLQALLVHVSSDQKLHSSYIPVFLKVFQLLSKTSSNFGESLTFFSPLLSGLLQNSENSNFVTSIIYNMTMSTLSQTIINRENPLDFFNQLLDYIESMISENIPHYTYLTASLAFVRIISLLNDKKFAFVHTQIPQLIGRISLFYMNYFKKFSSYSKLDQQLFTYLYDIDLNILAIQLPDLIKIAPSSSTFNASVLMPLFHLYLTQSDERTKNSVAEALYVIMTTDFFQHRDYVITEKASIQALDQVSSLGDMKPLMDLFSTTKAMFKKITSQEEHTFDRLKNITIQIDDLSMLPMEPQFENERSLALMGVIQSCRANHDIALYSHFTSKLFEMHMKFGNSVEAAMTLVEAAHAFSFKSQELVAEGHGAPEQPERIRKRSILEKSTQLFIKSNFFEKALNVLDFLEQYYSNDCVNYERLSQIYDQRANCYELITGTERNVLNRFYGVKFYGETFSDYFKGQTFIFRRDGFFMNDQMMRELTEKFTGAKISPKPPDDTELAELNDPNSGKSFVYIFNVKPDTSDVFDFRETPSSFMASHFCDVSKFFSEKPIRKRRPADAEKLNEMAEWYREIVRYDVRFPLQGMVRISPIIRTGKPEILSPIECAIVDVNAKTVDLMRTACFYWRCLRYDLKFEPAGVSSFLMAITGIVNAAVNGGTAVFQQLFFESSMKDEEIVKKFSDDLKNAFADQLKAVKFALQVHANVLAKETIPLHQSAVENFHNMCEKMQPVIGEVKFDEKPTFGVIPPTDFLKCKFDMDEEKQTEEKEKEEQTP